MTGVHSFSFNSMPTDAELHGAESKQLPTQCSNSVKRGGPKYFRTFPEQLSIICIIQFHDEIKPPDLVGLVCFGVFDVL